MKNGGLQEADVPSPTVRMSLAELMTVCKNAIRLSSDPNLPYRIGTTIHVSAYGMYGYAILCCPDFRKAMEFATSYHALAPPLATIEFSEAGESAMWTIEPSVHAVGDQLLYRFIAELQIGVHISLMRDIMHATF